MESIYQLIVIITAGQSVPRSKSPCQVSLLFFVSPAPQHRVVAARHQDCHSGLSLSGEKCVWWNLMTSPDNVLDYLL